MIGLSWAWYEIRPQVIALEDPLSISSNVILVDDTGGLLPGESRILHLNWTVHTLHWQKAVLARSGQDHQSAPLVA
jgi:hypothetical protein